MPTLTLTRPAFEWEPLHRPRLKMPALGVGVILPVYLLCHFGLRLLESASLRWDEGEQTLFTQQLALGYNDQPPVYTWLLWALFRVTGVSLTGVYLLKLACVGATYYFLYRIARRLMPERLALLSVFSLLLVPYFAWTVLADGAHTPFVCAVTAAAVLSALRALERPTAGRYAVLGLLLGLGVLAKYSFALVALALPAAAATIPAYRRRLLDARVLVAAAVGALLVLPHALWVLNHWDLIRSRPMERGGFGQEHSVASGFASLGATGLLVAGTITVALGLLSPRGSIRVWRTPARSDEARLLGRWLVVVGLALVGLVLLGVTRFRTHWLIPAAMFLPVYWFARLQEVRLPPARLKWFGRAIAAAALVVMGVRAGIASEGLYRGQDEVFDRLGEHVRAAGLERAPFIGDHAVVCGNLRLRCPEARVDCLFYPAYSPALVGDGETCVFVWNATEYPTTTAALSAWLKSHGGQAAIVPDSLTYIDVPEERADPGFRRMGLIQVRPQPPADVWLLRLAR